MLKFPIDLTSNSFLYPRQLLKLALEIYFPLMAGGGTQLHSYTLQFRFIFYLLTSKQVHFEI